MKWHKKLGQVNERDLKEMVKNKMMRGLDFKEKTLGTCETCIKGKFSTLPFKSHGQIISTEVLQIIHSDVCGPFENESMAGSKYFVKFIDDYTRYCCVYFLKEKSQVIDKFKEYKNYVELFHKKKIQNLQFDNGGEFRSKAFDKFLKDNGISRRLSAPYTPQQNGMSERKNRSLMDKARCLMLDANIPAKFWAEAVNTANYLINRSPARALKGNSPYEKWVQRTPSGNHLHVFGNRAFVMNKKRRGKFTDKATERVFLGYAEHTKGFRIYIPERNDVIISRDVKVIEKMHYGGTPAEKREDHTPEPETEQIEIQETRNKINENLPFQESNPLYSSSSQDPVDEPFFSSGRPQRDVRPPAWTKDYELSRCVTMLTSENNDDYDCSLLTYKEAVTGTDRRNWEKAIQSEMESLQKNNTWVFVDKSEAKGHKILLNLVTRPQVAIQSLHRKLPRRRNMPIGKQWEVYCTCLPEPGRISHKRSIQLADLSKIKFERHCARLMHI
ncbi:unnamed protein product [Pieris macdunnoughi]|uniref:Integrase catalytic domain-containing protein n=1 Tax=Pieris macdunnoughi TaxID=345717 RepID=A0A821XWX9_9NEOP|nr:unnamed protein product [Pieris macdunnoughi]